VNAELFSAVADLEKEKGIPRGFMLDKISQALLAAYKRDYDAMATSNVFVVPNEEKKEFRMFVRKEIVDEVIDSETQILLDAAREIDPTVMPGGFVDIDIKTRQFGRIAAQTAKQVIIQGIREAERGLTLKEYASREHEIATATVQRVDPKNGNAFLRMSGKENDTEYILLAGEQIAGETLYPGDLIKVYIVEARSNSRGPQLLISRTHPGLVKRLFELEVPEIQDGTVEIMSIAREAGARTKLAVRSNDPNVDPIGTCVGPRGSRVENIVSELRGEKMDIINYSDDPALFVASSLSPAEVISVELLEGKSCRVLVPDDQLSLAIGRMGQNARLAARLTGYKIDIKPVSQMDYSAE